MTRRDLRTELNTIAVWGTFLAVVIFFLLEGFGDSARFAELQREIRDLKSRIDGTDSIETRGD